MLTGLLMTVTMLISNMKQKHKGNVVLLYPKAMLRRVLTGNQMLHVQVLCFSAFNSLLSRNGKRYLSFSYFMMDSVNRSTVISRICGKKGNRTFLSPKAPLGSFL